MSTVIVALIVILALVLGWHLIFPILGGVIAITAIAWLVIIASIVAFSIGILLVFIIGGAGVFILAFIALVWVVIAVVLFPILFPILAPLFIVLLIIAYLRRKRQG